MYFCTIILYNNNYTIHLDEHKRIDCQAVYNAIYNYQNLQCAFFLSIVINAGYQNHSKVKKL